MRHSGLPEPGRHVHLLVFLLHVAEGWHADEEKHTPFVKYRKVVPFDATRSTMPSPSKSANWKSKVKSEDLRGISAKGSSLATLKVPSGCCSKYRNRGRGLSSHTKTKSRSPSPSRSTTAGQYKPRAFCPSPAVAKFTLQKGLSLPSRRWKLKLDSWEAHLGDAWGH